MKYKPPFDFLASQPILGGLYPEEYVINKRNSKGEFENGRKLTQKLADKIFFRFIFLIIIIYISKLLFSKKKDK